MRDGTDHGVVDDPALETSRRVVVSVRAVSDDDDRGVRPSSVGLDPPVESSSTGRNVQPLLIIRIEFQVYLSRRPPNSDLPSKFGFNKFKGKDVGSKQ